MDDTNQHYITKAYLDRFVHPESHDKILYPYKKSGGACKPRGTKQLGSAVNFYRQKLNGELSDRLDGARMKSESVLFASGKRNLSSMAKLVFDDRPSISQSEKLELAAAAAFLFCGSPVQIHNTAMHLLALHQLDLFN